MREDGNMKKKRSDKVRNEEMLISMGKEKTITRNLLRRENGPEFDMC